MTITAKSLSKSDLSSPPELIEQWTTCMRCFSYRDFYFNKIYHYFFHQLIVGLEEPVVLAMVGLPARGKSYIVKMLIRYLRWSGFDAAMFNVGSYRREIGLASTDASFFDSENPNATKIR